MTAILFSMWAFAAAGSARQTAPAVRQTGVQAKTATIRGTIVDAKTAAPIAGARVMLAELNHPVITVADGTFEFGDLAPGKFTLTVSLIGYSFVRRPVSLAPGQVLDITVPLSEGTGSYQETVTVKAASAPPEELGVSSQNTLGSAMLQSLRGVAADDPMRALQALPGVATGDDFQAQFSMRGFAFREVGIVMDGTATPLLLHSVQGERDTGSIAMINSDVLSQASLMAGPHPLKDGNWLGPTLSFDMREGSRDRTSVRAAVSGTSASTVLEGPIGGAHKGSWLFSLRKSYIDWLVQKIAPDIGDTVGFVDAQAKLAYDLTSRQQISMTFVGGNGDFNQTEATGINALRKATSRSALASAAWRYNRSSWVVTQRVSFATNVFLNKGTQGQEQGRGDAPSTSYRGDATWQINPAWSLDFGARHEHSDENLTLTNYTTAAGLLKVKAKLDAELSTADTDGWGQLTFRTPHGGFVVGARGATDRLTGQTVAAPWLLGEAHLGKFTLRAGAGESHQFPSLDVQAASIPRLVPAAARSVDAGIAQQIGRGFLWQISGWTRQNHDVVRQIGEDQLVNGKRVVASLFPQFASTLDGRSRGVDLLLARHGTAGVTGWVAYTYAHTRFHDHATGEDFDGDFDQRHTLNAFVEARLSYRLAVNARFRYGSNFPIVGYFSGTPFNLLLATTRNMVRLPEYARLDLRVNRAFTFHTKRLTLFVEVMNLLNRYNYGQSTGTISSTVAKDIVTRLIPRIPSAGFLFEF